MRTPLMMMIRAACCCMILSITCFCSTNLMKATKPVKRIVTRRGSISPELESQGDLESVFQQPLKKSSTALLPSNIKGMVNKSPVDIVDLDLSPQSIDSSSGLTTTPSSELTSILKKPTQSKPIRGARSRLQSIVQQARFSPSTDTQVGSMERDFTRQIKKSLSKSSDSSSTMDDQATTASSLLSSGSKPMAPSTPKAGALVFKDHRGRRYSFASSSGSNSSGKDSPRFTKAKYQEQEALQVDSLDFFEDLMQPVSDLTLDEAIRQGRFSRNGVYEASSSSDTSKDRSTPQFIRSRSSSWQLPNPISSQRKSPSNLGPSLWELQQERIADDRVYRPKPIGHRRVLDPSSFNHPQNRFVLDLHQRLMTIIRSLDSNDEQENVKKLESDMKMLDVSDDNFEDVGEEDEDEEKADRRKVIREDYEVLEEQRRVNTERVEEEVQKLLNSHTLTELILSTASYRGQSAAYSREIHQVVKDILAMASFKLEPVIILKAISKAQKLLPRTPFPTVILKGLRMASKNRNLVYHKAAWSETIKTAALKQDRSFMEWLLKDGYRFQRSAVGYSGRKAASKETIYNFQGCRAWIENYFEPKQRKAEEDGASVTRLVRNFKEDMEKAGCIADEVHAVAEIENKIDGFVKGTFLPNPELDLEEQVFPNRNAFILFMGTFDLPERLGVGLLQLLLLFDRLDLIYSALRESPDINIVLLSKWSSYWTKALVNLIVSNNVHRVTAHLVQKIKRVHPSSRILLAPIIRAVVKNCSLDLWELVLHNLEDMHSQNLVDGALSYYDCAFFKSELESVSHIRLDDRTRFSINDYLAALGCNFGR